MRYQKNTGQQMHTQGQTQQVIQRQGLENLAVPLNIFYRCPTLKLYQITHYGQPMNITQTQIIRICNNSLHKYTDIHQ